MTDPRTVTCTRPSDGDLTFTVRSDDVRAATAITLTAEAGDPFVELDPSDDAASTRLAPRPTYDFSLGALSLVDHTVTGRTDHYVLRGAVGALPDGVDALGYEVTGGTFAADQPSGCTRTTATRATCTGGGRDVDLRVDSEVGTRHDVSLALVLPRRYDDPRPGDDSATVTVAPGVDLHAGPLTPADPRADGDTYQVSSVLTGVREGPVTWTLSGPATVVGSSCTVAGGTRVVCAAPSEGMRVGFTIRPDHPSAGADVTLTAAPAPPLTELDEADDTTAASLRPDVVLDSLAVTGHRLGSQQALVRAQVSGAPSTVSSVRVRLSGGAVGLGADQVHLTDGVSGADGEGAVDCYTSDASGRGVNDGVYATCTGITRALRGSFYIDLRLEHPHGRTSAVDVTVVPLDVDQGGHTANDTRTVRVP